MLRVIEYFAKSLKIIRTDTVEYNGVCKSLLVFHWTYVSELFSVKEWHDLETGVGVVQGHWKWRSSIDHNTTFYWSAIVNIVLCYTIFVLFDVE